jgi:hypothetical protein
MAHGSADVMENEVFSGGPPWRLEAWLRLRRVGESRVVRQAIGAAGMAWLPLLALTMIRGDAWVGSGSFFQDYAVHARCLVAIPLLILAESTCLPQLSAIAQHFLDTDIVRDADESKYFAAIVSTRRWRDSKLAEFAAIACAYSLIAVMVLSETQPFAAWQMAAGHGWQRLSPAGWWQLLVSLPLLLVFGLGWLWRLFLWTRFLWLVSRLNLHLLAAHPDRAGGLMFVGYSIRAWALPAATPAVIVAGGIANRLVHQGASISSYKFLILGLTVCAVLSFVAPLAVFTGNLLTAWRKGIRQYGALAEQVGHKLEQDWMARTREFAENPLQTQAFSATTDLYQIVANAYAMKFMPVDLISVALLASATLLPFLPVLLISQPLDQMLNKLAGFLI